MTDQEIEDAAQAAGGSWDGNVWRFEDADLHPFVRSILAASVASPAAPASPSVAQAEPGEVVIPRGKYRLVPVEPRPDCCNRGLDKHGRASGECCWGGGCAHDEDVKRAEDSWIAATLPSTPKAEGEGKQS